MIRFDEVTWQQLQMLAQQADCSAAEMIRCLITQATGEASPLRGEEPRARHERGAHGRD
jgi:hypothetical protein